MKIGLYIENKKVDLFDDENIFYENKLQDLDDLSSIFSDSTNTFTIPASRRNNELFNNWFEISYSLIANFNAQKRVSGYIEIETTPYRFGRVQLEGVGYKNGKVNNYKITFYSEVLNLDDLFGDDLISNLYEDDVKFQWNEVNLKNLLQYPSLVNEDLCMPLIFPYEGNFTELSEIELDNLRPSIRISKIIEKIESNYNISFDSIIFDDDKFTNLFMWLNKNEEQFLSSNYIGIGESDLILEANFDSSQYYPQYSSSFLYNFVNASQVVTINVDVSDNTIDYIVRLTNQNNNSILLETDTLTGNSQHTFVAFNINLDNESVFNNNFRVDVIPKNTLDIDLNVNVVNTIYGVTSDLNVNPSSYFENVVDTFTINETFTVETFFSVRDNLPDMEVKDFISNIFKLFNLVIRPTSQNSFIIDTYENYIKRGNKLDLTKLLDLNDIESERKELNRLINFKYQEGDSQFNKLQNFGNGTYKYDIDSKAEKDIEFDFELATFARLIDTNLNLYLLQNENFEPSWSDNPIIHYFLGNTIIKPSDTDLGINFKLNDDNVFNLKLLSLCDSSNNYLSNQVTNDLHFSDVVGSNYHSSFTDFNQYNNFYKYYLDIIYSTNSRVINFNLNLDNDIIENIDINTKIILQNNLYLIEDFKINLLTGKTSLKVFPTKFEPDFTSTGFLTRKDDVVNELFLNFNSSLSFSSFRFFSNDNITLEKIDTGDNTNWLILENNNYNKGLNVIKFKVNVYNNTTLGDSRSMIIRVNNNFDLTITQSY